MIHDLPSPLIGDSLYMAAGTVDGSEAAAFLISTDVEGLWLIRVGAQGDAEPRSLGFAIDRKIVKTLIAAGFSQRSPWMHQPFAARLPVPSQN